MQEDMHSPGYAAEGASFPGTGFVELGRGVDYAWSATSAGSDLTDQRLELICNPLGGKPVAVVNQRSTYNHDVDSVIGFLGFGSPALTHSAKSWMAAASHIDYTFNWLYADSKDIAYYVSGLDPVRPEFVDPNLPTWGTGGSEWLGFLPASKHVHQINPPQGFFDSWNNTPAPLFSASDGQYGYGPVYRVQMLTAQIRHQFSVHHGKITRADLVQAMETAASQDLDGLTILPALLKAVGGRHEPAGVDQMLAALRAWHGTGAHRILSSASDAQYEQADAVAIMDKLTPAVIGALFDPLFAAGGTNSGGYDVFPMGFVNEPLSGGGGLSGCGPALDAALESAYQALVKANGGSKNVATWTQDANTVAAGLTMPAYDAIGFRSLGIVGQPSIPWQNRPTFQTVVSFPAHRAG